MTFTKGGWHRNIKPASKYPVIFAGRNTHVAMVLSKGLPDEEVEANCNLIAAAPALLEALKQLTEQFEILLPRGAVHDERQALIAAKAAIARASGEL